MKKKLLALLLCAALLCTALASCAAQGDAHDHEDDDVHTDLPDDEVPMGGLCDGNHSFSVTTVKINDCVYGMAEEALHKCSVCGFSYHTATRPDNTTFPNGTHSFSTVSTPSACSGNPAQAKICSTCGYSQLVSYGGHSWGAWTTEDGGSACTSKQVRTCTYCGEKEEKAPVGHSWRQKSSTPATCTEPAKEEQECNQCHATQTVEKGAALGHSFGANTDCTKERTCSRCGETKAAGSHTWGDYVKTAEGHYQRCQMCGQTTELVRHTDNGAGYCDVCGYQMRSDAKPGQCAHDWQVSSKSTFSHVEKCSKCGATRSVNCADSVPLSSRTDCTQTVYCVCGNVAFQGFASHDMTYNITKDASGHTRHCRHVGCTHTETEAHDFIPTSSCTSPSKCSVCGYASGTAAYKDHEWGPWIDNGSGSHTRKCTHTGCTAMQSAAHTAGSGSSDCTSDMLCADCGAVITTGNGDHAWGHAVSVGAGGHNQSCTTPGCDAKRNSAHTGGTATCAAPARCSVCGDSYGAKDPANHTGATEIRDAKAAQEGVEGYSGDVYCADCGVKLSEGHVIPALEAGHTHSYSAEWSTDKDSHWHECGCGDRQSVAAHTYSNGVCTVCGAKDPSFVEHVHTFTDTWSADSQSHWHVCTSCGEKTEVAEHVFAAKDGVDQCVGCGLTQEQQYTDKAVETFTDVHENIYYAKSVGWAVENGITNGKRADAFAAEDTCTELEILTMLYRAAGNPNGTMDEARAWALEKGMIGEDFDPDAECTRAAAVTYMWLAADRPDADEASFEDVDANAAYAEAVAWAAANNITTGADVNKETGGALFAPDDTCTRGQIVTFLYRAK